MRRGVATLVVRRIVGEDAALGAAAAHAVQSTRNYTNTRTQPTTTIHRTIHTHTHHSHAPHTQEPPVTSAICEPAPGTVLSAADGEVRVHL